MPRPDTAWAAVLAYLTEHPGSTRREVCEALEGHTPTIGAAVGTLAARGLPIASRSRPVRYRVRKEVG